MWLKAPASAPPVALRRNSRVPSSPSQAMRHSSLHTGGWLLLLLRGCYVTAASLQCQCQCQCLCLCLKGCAWRGRVEQVAWVSSGQRASPEVGLNGNHRQKQQQQQQRLRLCWAFPMASTLQFVSLFFFLSRLLRSQWLHGRICAPK